MRHMVIDSDRYWMAVTLMSSSSVNIRATIIHNDTLLRVNEFPHANTGVHETFKSRFTIHKNTNRVLFSTTRFVNAKYAQIPYSKYMMFQTIGNTHLGG